MNWRNVLWIIRCIGCGIGFAFAVVVFICVLVAGDSLKVKIFAACILFSLCIWLLHDLTDWFQKREDVER